MLYLIRTFGINPKKNKLLKVGYTGDLAKRMNTYKTQNPFFLLLGTREGDETMEMKMHLYLTALGLKANLLNEWFLDNDKTLREFHAGLDKIDRIIWQKRNELFTLADFGKNKLKTEIYENLRLQYNGKILKQEIDIGWKFWSTNKILKQIKKTQFPYI